MSNENRFAVDPQSANARQVGGGHYKTPIEHWDYVAANNLDYFQAQITKYITRWKKKNGIQDLRKAQHFLEKYIELAHLDEARLQGMKIGLNSGEDFVKSSGDLIKVEVLNSLATVPTRNKTNDAGLDLYAANELEICLHPGFSTPVPTGIALEIPEGYHGQIWTRSGLGAKNGIEVGAGIIDAGYRGELIVILRNLGHEPFYISRGMKIAQLVLVETIFPAPVIVPKLSDSERGQAGFGSSGV